MAPPATPEGFANSQALLEAKVPRIRRQRRDAGLEGLVGGLSAIIINTEPHEQRAAVGEMLTHTGLELQAAYEGPAGITCVLKTAGSPDVLIASRRGRDNPFAPLNDRPKTRHLPNTRLETLVFDTSDLPRWLAVQKARGVRFLTPEPVLTDKYAFIQTVPSAYTGTSTGLVQWFGRRGDRDCPDMTVLDWNQPKPASAYSANVHQLDHVAVRVRAEDRDAAILELMELTSYDFDEAYYVEELNSITNVTRGGKGEAAIVVTSGISPYADDATSGPTEKFVHGYGARTHHLAFWTDKIEGTFAALKSAGQEFLIELVGSPAEGLKQTFTQPLPHTLLVREYIYRYGDFDGFFTRSNITALTRATEKQ
jgi:hypothetical protein